jgi:hypothetical protein
MARFKSFLLWLFEPLYLALTAYMGRQGLIQFVNTELTISKITNEALMVLENSLTFTMCVNRDYDDQYAVVGAKIGDTVNVRRPVRVIGTTGPNLNIEDFNETSIPVVLTTQFHTDTQFGTKELALNVDMFSDRVLKPLIAAIANKIDFQGTTTAANGIANIVGTPGTPPTALLTYLTAAAFLDAEGTPRDGERSCVIEPFTSATIIDALKGLFVPQDKISSQYMRGLMGRDSAGMNWYNDQNIVSHTFGFATGATTVTVNGANQGLATGWAATSTISINNSANNITLQVGDVLQFPGTFAVNPQNRQAYGSNKLRNFVVTQAVTQSGAGNFNVVVSPAVIYGGQFQNVTAAPTTGGTVTFTSLPTSGASGAVISPQNIVLHRNALTLAVADLELPEGVHFAGRASDEEIGLSIRVVRQYTINNDAIPTRLDVLFGWAMLYPELGCRVAA